MNTITPISISNHKNNNISFQRLKGIHCYNKFIPSENLDDAEAIKAFKNSKVFKDFFKKYNGTAEFRKVWQTPKQLSRLEIRMKYPKNENLKNEKNPIKKIINNIKDFFNEDANYRLSLNFEGSWKSWVDRPSDSLKEVISNLTEQDLEKELSLAIKKAKKDEKEANRIAELSKKLNFE